MPRTSTLPASRRLTGAVHPLAADAARLIAGHRMYLAAMTSRRDALPATNPMRAVLTHGIAATTGIVRQLEVCLPDGWSADQVLAAACDDCAAGYGQPHGRGCRSRYGELDD